MTKAYWPIALLDTIKKLLKKIITSQLSRIAEKMNILPASQIKAKLGHSMQTVLELLTQQIHTMWRSNPNLIALLLSLNISEAFNQISYKK